MVLAVVATNACMKSSEPADGPPAKTATQQMAITRGSGASAIAPVPVRCQTINHQGLQDGDETTGPVAKQPAATIGFDVTCDLPQAMRVMGIERHVRAMDYSGWFPTQVEYPLRGGPIGLPTNGNPYFCSPGHVQEEFCGVSKHQPPNRSEIPDHTSSPCLHNWYETFEFRTPGTAAHYSALCGKMDRDHAGGEKGEYFSGVFGRQCIPADYDTVGAVTMGGYGMSCTFPAPLHVDTSAKWAHLQTGTVQMPLKEPVLTDQVVWTLWYDDFYRNGFSPIEEYATEFWVLVHPDDAPRVELPIPPAEVAVHSVALEVETCGCAPSPFSFELDDPHGHGCRHGRDAATKADRYIFADLGTGKRHYLDRPDGDKRPDSEFDDGATDVFLLNEFNLPTEISLGMAPNSWKQFDEVNGRLAPTPDRWCVARVALYVNGEKIFEKNPPTQDKWISSGDTRLIASAQEMLVHPLNTATARMCMFPRTVPTAHFNSLTDAAIANPLLGPSGPLAGRFASNGSAMLGSTSSGLKYETEIGGVVGENWYMSQFDIAYTCDQAQLEHRLEVTNYKLKSAMFPVFTVNPGVRDDFKFFCAPFAHKNPDDCEGTSDLELAVESSLSGVVGILGRAAPLSDGGTECERPAITPRPDGSIEVQGVSRNMLLLLCPTLAEHANTVKLCKADDQCDPAELCRQGVCVAP